MFHTRTVPDGGLGEKTQAATREHPHPNHPACVDRLVPVKVEAGTAWDRYEVEDLVGSGGMARVYRVRHRLLGSLHAVKVLHLPTPSVIDRLMREGRAQSSLRHPNIVAVTDVIDVGGAPGLVMEWIGGPSLADLIGAHRLSLGEVRAVADGLFAGIAAAHEAGWVHRDLKPGNVLLQQVGDALVPRVTDFGLVKALQGSSPDELTTRTGAVMGTPAYMAPEQLVDAGAVDHRADIWALGAMLYELVTGERPFQARDLRGRLQQMEAPTPPSQLCPELPTAAEQAILAAMRAEVADRTANLGDLSTQWASADWPEPPGWRAATLEGARELALVPVARDSLATDGSETVSVGLDLFGPTPGTPQTLHEPTNPPAMVPQAARSRTGPLAAATIAVGLLGAGAWYASAPGTPPVTLPTSTQAPDLGRGPEVQEQLDLAWQSLLQGDLNEATRRLETVDAAAPDARWPNLIRGYTMMRDHQVMESLSVSRHLVEKWPDAPGASGSLIRVIGAQHTGTAAGEEAMRAHRERYPDDFLAQLMSTDFCAMVHEELCEREIPALIERAPRLPITWHVATESWQEVGYFDRARETVERGLQVAPDDPVLLEFLARDQLERQDLDAAAASLARLQRVAPASAARRELHVRQAVLTGNEEALGALRAELTSSSQPLATRIAFYADAADTLLGLGRLEAAETLLTEAVAIARSTSDAATEFHLHLQQRAPAMQRGDYPAARGFLRQAALVAAENPEIPRAHRDRLTGFHLWIDGMEAVSDGDLDAARGHLKRLRSAPNAADETIEALERAVAVAERDPVRVAQLADTLWNGVCAKESIVGNGVLQAGDPAAAIPRLERALSTSCRRYTSGRTNEVLARVALAEAQLALEDRAAAREQLTVLQGLWTQPDPDALLAKRLSRLSEELAIP